MNKDERSGAGAIVLLAYVTLAWGLAWPVTKIAVEQVPVWHWRAGTALLGGLCMLMMAAAVGQIVAVPRRELVRLAVLGQFNVTLWSLLSAYGVSLMEAGRAGIIAFTMPIWAAMLGAMSGRERLTGAKLLALTLGTCGLAALLLPEWDAIRAAPFGVLAMLGSAVAWAVGALGVKHQRWSCNSAVQSGWQLLFGGVAMAVGLPFIGERFEIAAIDAVGWAAVVYLFVFSMLLAQWAWFAAVHALSATVAGIGTLLVPVVGVLGSAWWLGERIGLAEIAALVLIGASVLLAVRPESRIEEGQEAARGGLGLDPKRLR